MSRLLFHSCAASKCSQYGYVGRICVQHKGSKRQGLIYLDLLAYPKKFESLGNPATQSCRHLHAVGQAQREREVRRRCHRNCSVSTDALIAEEGWRSISNDRDQTKSRIWQLASNTRLPLAFFLDLNRLCRLPSTGSSMLGTDNNSKKQVSSSRTIQENYKDEQLWTGLDDSTSSGKVGQQSHHVFNGHKADVNPSETKPDLRRENRSSHLFISKEGTPSDGIWAPKYRPGKLDLSYGEPLHREYKLSNILPLHLPDQRTFRDDQGDRRTTKLFMDRIYQRLSITSEVSDEHMMTFIRDSGLPLTPQSAFKGADLLTWSWILLAGGSTAVKRLVAFAASQKDVESPSVPLWVVLQILRAERLDAESLHMLLSHIAQNHQSWVLWHGSASMLLVVRLLRHARLTAPSCYEPITNLFLKLLEIRFMSEGAPSGLQRSAHWCNRMLSLIAIPTNTNPYRSIPLQQASQLEILRHMQESQPEIPITREGYRALARVQLMHAKTYTEMEWAQAKALTWPPFQNQHQMGVSPSHEYAGKRSRVMKVLQRMAETGYCPHDFDMATQILAGWDVDNTPTIQTRTSAYPIMRPKLWEPGSSPKESNLAPEIWAARVQGTRTVREAWMCFCAYHKETHQGRQSALVYHAMFRKLLAKSVTYSENGPVPGDGRETFPDSDLQREVVFISESIPPVSEFYSRMIDRGIQPFGRFLADLVLLAPTLERGLQYIRDARMVESTKQIFIDPGRHSDNAIAQAISSVPIMILRSYISLLTRTPTKALKQWHCVGWTSKSMRNGIGQRYAAVQIAKNLLTISNVTDISVWNAYLTGLVQHLHHRSYQGVRTLDVQDVWDRVVDAIPQVYDMGQCDFKTFESVATVAIQIQIAKQSGVCSDVSPVTLTKRLFITAATGYIMRDVQSGSMRGSWHGFCRSAIQNRILKSMPTGDNIESMVWVLASQNSQDQIDNILDLLHWLKENSSQIAAAGFKITKHNMCAFRIFLEGSWAGLLKLAQDDLVSIPAASPEQLRESQQLAEAFGWPDDSTVLRYIKSRKKYGILKRLHEKFTKSSNMYT